MNSRLVAFYMQFWCSFSAKMSRLKILKNGSLFVNLSSCARETIHFTFLFLLFSLFCFPVVQPQDVEDPSRANCGYDIKKEGVRVARGGSRQQQRQREHPSDFHHQILNLNPNLQKKCSYLQCPSLKMDVFFFSVSIKFFEPIKDLVFSVHLLLYTVLQLYFHFI